MKPARQQTIDLEAQTIGLKDTTVDGGPKKS